MDDLKWVIARETPHLRRYARVLTGDAERADDLVQDCLERALRKRHLWQPKGSLRSWLFRMLYRVHLNSRKGRMVERLSVPLDAAGIERSISPANQEARVEFQNIADALERLPDAQRQAIMLVGLEGMSYEEAAWILEIPIGTLRSRLSRGREALAALYSDDAGRAQLRRVK